MKLIWIFVLVALCPSFAFAQSGQPVETVLPDGIKLICSDEPSSSLVAITIFVQTGSAEENLNDAGIGSMVADALLSGTSNQNADAIATSIGAVGGNVKAIWQPDVTQIRALILPSAFDDAVYLLADVLKNASFMPYNVETARQDLLDRIQEQSDDVFQSTNDRLRQTLYAGTPYAIPEIGTSDTIKTLTRSDLLRYFYRFYRPDNILISVVGNIDPHLATRVIGGELSDFERPNTYHLSAFNIPAPSTSSVPIVVKSYQSDVTAGLMMAGYLAPGVGTPDYPAMVVANALLGGMKTSLMFKNLRIKNKYGYEVASNYTEQVGVSDVTGYILFSPKSSLSDETPSIDQTSVVKYALIDQFRLLTTAPPTEADLARAKKFVIGSYLLAHERIEDRSYYLGYSEIGCKPLGGYLFDSNYANAINAVTGADIQRVAKKYFSGAPVISLMLPGDSATGVVND
jgi:zinc protease